MKDPFRSVVIGILAIVALAFAAVTIDSMVEDPDSARPPGSGGGDGRLFPIPEPEPMPTQGLDILFLSELFSLLVLIVAVALIAFVLLYWRRSLGLLLAAVALLIVLYVLSQLVAFPGDLGGIPLTPGNVSEPGNGGEGGATPPTSSPSVILLLVVFIGVLGIVALLHRTRTEAPLQTENEDDGLTAASVGRAAGRAADRLEEQSDPENEVFRAWREMTELLDVERQETSTPGEFADAATAAGLGRDDVAELTRLFEDVRYGSARVTEQYEQRAIAVFRRIESRYVEEHNS